MLEEGLDRFNGFGAVAGLEGFVCEGFGMGRRAGEWREGVMVLRPSEE